MVSKTIAIIGAGAAGLSSARHALAAGHRVQVFEQAEQLGGTWVYTEETGLDVNGQEILTSMYAGLLTNLPKEIMCYPDVPFPEEPDSYVTSHSVHQYLEKFTDDFQLRQHIKFAHSVIRIRPCGETRTTHWEVIVHDVKADRYETLTFDAVFVCTGRNSYPNIPSYPGSDLFRGNIMHSHRYRTAEAFAGKRVLIVGASASGFELSGMIGKHAQSVTLSHFKTLRGNASGAKVRPGIERFSETKVHFVDGETDEFDEVVFCTGFRLKYPFLSTDCGLHVEEYAYVRPLFKECININQPTMFVLGIPYRNIGFQVLDLQARFCLAYLDGKRELPSREDMLAITEADMQQRMEKYGGYIRHMHMLDTFEKQYHEDLATLGGLEPVKPYVLAIFHDAIEYVIKHGLKFRQQRYRVLNDVDFEKTVAGEKQ